MMAATKSKDGKGKSKFKGKGKACCSNPNCNKVGHTINQCYTKGGRKEKEVLEWFKKLAAREGASASAHVTEQGQDDGENYAMLTYTIPEGLTTLVVTSDFKAEAHAISADHGIIYPHVSLLHQQSWCKGGSGGCLIPHTSEYNVIAFSCTIGNI